MWGVQFPLSLIMLFKELCNFFIVNISSIFVLTLFNCLYSIGFIGSSTVFIIREVVLLLFLYILYYYRAEFGIMAIGAEYIKTVVYRKAPVLRYYWLIGFLSIFMTIGFSAMDFPEGQPFYIDILFNFSVFLWFVFLSLSLLRFSILYRSPELSDFFNVRKSIRHHGLWSFSTASKLLHNWKQSGPFIVFGAVGLDIVGTKFFNGSLGARSFTENFGSKNLTQHGLMARTNGISIAANHFVDYYPHLKPTLLDKDGYVDPMKLALAFKDQKGPIKISPPRESFLYVEFEHNHNITLGSSKSSGSSSTWLTWAKK